MKKNRLTFLAAVLLVTTLIFSCAKRGSLTGGPEDETPPEFVRSSPPNYSINFKSNEIRIYFDELIKLENPQKQIIISPPIKNKPDITPLGIPGKFIKIKFNDTLIENTTYTINFGESVVDNNEANPLPFFQYVFSTGPVLDSLSLKGSVKDAFKKKLDEYVSVFLYEINEKHTDSTVFKDQPRYISSTLDTTLFEFKNLKAGKYQLIALKDNNSNYTFEPKSDKIGFVSEPINIPKDSIAQITIFKEVPQFKFARAKQASKNKFIVGYQGLLDSVEVNVLGNTPPDLKTRFLKEKDKDTLNVWVKPFFEQDSLVFLLKNNKVIDTIVSRYKDQYKDSLQVQMKNSGTVKLNENVVITANNPIEIFNVEKVKIIDEDTLEVNFENKLDRLKNEIQLSFSKKEEARYAIKILPEAITDFMENVNDTINLNVSTKKQSEYGKLILNFEGINEWPVIVQLLKNPDEPDYEEIATLKNENKSLTFTSVEPADYFVKLIFDTNKNNTWDTGNYLKKIKPERIFYYEKPITVRPNWDVKQIIVVE